MQQQDADLVGPAVEEGPRPLVQTRAAAPSGPGSAGATGPARPAVLRILGMVGIFQVGILAARLFRAKALALTLGPNGVGLQSVVDQIMLTASLLFTASLPFAAVKFLSFAHSEEGSGFADLYRALRRIVLGLSLLGAVIGIALVMIWPNLFGTDIAHHRTILVLALLAVPAFNLIPLITSALAATQQVRASAAYQFAQWSSVAVLSAAGVLIAGLTGFFIGSGIGFMLVALGGVVYLRRTPEVSRSERSPSDTARRSLRDELRRHPGLLRFSAVQSVLTISTPIAYLVARFTVLDHGGLAQAGLFAAAFTTAQSLTNVLNPANALFLTPAMNRNDSPHIKLAEALRFRDGLIVAFALLALPAVLFPTLVVQLIFASTFGAAGSYLFVFILAEGLLLLSGVQQALLIGLDDFASNVVIVVAGQIVLTVLAVVLVPGLGVEGVAVALLADYALVVVLTGWRLRHRHGMSMLGGVQLVPLGALAFLVAAGAAAPSLSSTSPAIFAVKVVAGVVVAAALVLHARRSGALRRTAAAPA